MRRPDGAGSSPAPKDAGAGTGSATLGLVCAPEIPEKIGRGLVAELPEPLSRYVDGGVSWEVSIVVDPLTGTDLQAPEILDACQERLRQEEWELAVCLTDLPVYRNGNLVVADASAARGVALVSIPALGATRLLSRAREATLQLVSELYAKGRGQKLGPDGTSRDAEEPGPPRGVPTGIISPFRRVEPPDEDMKNTNVDARFAAPGVLGRLRLLAGMVFANRPLKLFPSFKGTIAAAFATAAYVLVNPTLWTLADSVGWARLLVLMVAAIVAMVAWIIVAHHLWERRSDPGSRRWTTLYNGVTVLTVSVAVLFAYAVLFVLVLLAALVFVPGGYLQTTLKHPAGPGDYMALAWLATSLATVAGALGSSLEDEETVREAAYGYRQRRRNELKESEESRDDSKSA